MKKNFIKKIAAVAMAAVMTVGCAMSAMADDAYTTKLSFANAGNWDPSVWGDEGTTARTTVTGEGTYTLSWTLPEGKTVTGPEVFVVDIEGAYEAYSEWDVKDISVKVDGKEVTLDESKVVVADTEDKGNIRISFYNTTNDKEPNAADKAPFALADIAFSSTLEVTFTLDDPNTQPETEAPTEAPTTTAADSTTAADATTAATTTTTPNTGDSTMVATLLAVAALSAVVVLKKRTATN